MTSRKKEEGKREEGCCKAKMTIEQSPTAFRLSVAYAYSTPDSNQVHLFFLVS
jgi:hypothetical protein